jgi:hypothetical protein
MSDQEGRETYLFTYSRAVYEFAAALGLCSAVVWFVSVGHLPVIAKLLLIAVSPYPLFHWFLTILQGPREILMSGRSVSVRFFTRRERSWDRNDLIIDRNRTAWTGFIDVRNRRHELLFRLRRGSVPFSEFLDRLSAG